MPLIACIDDDEAIRNALKGFLSAANYSVDVYPSAEDFLRCQSIDKISFLITDLKLGGMSGLQLLKQLPGLGVTVPSAIITAYAEPNICNEAKETGLKAVFYKPVNLNEMLKLIESSVSEKLP